MNHSDENSQTGIPGNHHRSLYAPLYETFAAPDETPPLQDEEEEIEEPEEILCQRRYELVIAARSVRELTDLLKMHCAECPVCSRTSIHVSASCGQSRPAVAQVRPASNGEGQEVKMNQEERKQPMKEIVKFPINTPVEVALRFELGRRVEGRFGDQIMYSLIDNRVMYVPPFVEQRIRELAISAGEPLLLCKTELKDGNRKWVEWSVKRAPQQPLQSPNVTVAAEMAQSETPNHGNGSTNGKVNGHANGTHANGTHANGADTLSKVALVPSAVTSAGISAMEVALNGATELAQRVETRAASSNYFVRFSGEDIRAIGLTIFIQAMRDGGLRWQQ
jgi:hypothetical protein